MIPVLCRDCMALATFEAMPERCRECGSPRLLGHAELADLAIAHIDCDAFYATVEKRDRPEIAEQPVIVGGGTRGVVLACCYVARLYGVRSAMPRGAGRDDAADAAGRAIVDRRGFPRSERHSGSVWRGAGATPCRAGAAG
jgi:DNA polymerase-4